jgi:hypothetical protein
MDPFGPEKDLISTKPALRLRLLRDRSTINTWLPWAMSFQCLSANANFRDEDLDLHSGGKCWPWAPRHVTKAISARASF